MLRWIFRLLLLLVIGLLVYNYFFGDKKEKEQSAAIFKQAKELGKSLGQILISEKEKFDEGKYDKALNKAKDVLESLQSNRKKMDAGNQEKLDLLIAKEKQIREQLNRNKLLENTPEKEVEQQRLQSELRQLMQDIQQLLEKVDENADF